MQRIKTISTYMCFLLNILLITFPIYLILQWFLVDLPLSKQLGIDGFLFRPIITPEGAVHPSNIWFTSQTRMIAILTSIVCNIPTWIGFYLLRYVFKNYKDGHIFTLKNVKAYQKLGWLVFIDALLCKPLFGMGMVMVATLSNPPGHRYISIGIDLNLSLEHLCFGALFILISWIMKEAYTLKSEQEFTI